MTARKDPTDGDDFFTSQTSFDLEGKSAVRKRRRSRGGRERARPIQHQAEPRPTVRRKTQLDHDEIPHQGISVSECPGCGSEIDEGEFVDVMVSFVTGAADYLAGDPVRTQAVQALKQQAKSLDLPEPYDDWLLEICARLEAQIVRYSDARKNEIRAEAEEQLRQELIGDLYEHLKDEIEGQIRQQVEAEMWEQFQQMYREREE